MSGARIRVAIAVHPALMVLAHCAWDVDARRYAALYLDASDFPTEGAGALFRWLSCRVEDGVLPLRDALSAEASSLVPVLDNALAFDDDALERWPIERLVRRMLAARAPAQSDDLADLIAAAEDAAA